MTALARRADARSSHAAAADVESRGTAQAHRNLIASLIFMRPGETAHELADHSGGRLTSVQVSRRLKELEDAQLIARGPMRACRVARRLSLTWLPVPAQRSLFNEHINRAA